MSRDLIRLIDAAETHPLRSLVLRPGQPMSACVWEGDDNEASFHVGGFVGDELVSIASVLPVPLPCHVEDGRFPSPAYRLRGMATHPDHRGQGYASAVLQKCVHQVQSAGGAALWCNARTSAAGFYARHGWTILGLPFELPEIGPHVVMWRDPAA